MMNYIKSKLTIVSVFISILILLIGYMFHINRIAFLSVFIIVLLQFLFQNHKHKEHIKFFLYFVGSIVLISAISQHLSGGAIFGAIVRFKYFSIY